MSDLPWFTMALSVCYSTFLCLLTFGRCLSIDQQCNVKSQDKKCRHRKCWQKFPIAFTPPGSYSSCSFILPLPTSTQSDEVAVFYISFNETFHFCLTTCIGESLLLCVVSFFNLLRNMCMYILRNMYSTSFLVLCAGSFPGCTLWIRNTSSVQGDGSNAASGETAVYHSSSGRTADNRLKYFQLCISEISQPFFAVSHFFEIIILIKISRPWGRLLFSLYIYDLMFTRDLWSLPSTEFVEFTCLPEWFIFSITVKPHSALSELPSTSSPAAWPGWNTWNCRGVCSHHSLLLCGAVGKVGLVHRVGFLPGIEEERLCPRSSQRESTWFFCLPFQPGRKVCDL